MPLLETRGAASVQGFGALAASARNYIEDVFSTYLYTGNGSTQTITNGIDLSGKGGLVWVKQRDFANGHILVDTVRGGGKYLQTNTTDAQTTNATVIPTFTSTGFNTGGAIDSPAKTYVSWTFRKQAKFFDVVTYTGATGNAVQNISHNLGSIPGCIIVKCTDQPGYNWVVYHRSTGATQYTYLNTTAAAGTSSTFWNDTSPTATQFTVGTSGSVNGAGQQYVAYLFAHDAGGFGQSGSDNVISCGSYSGTGAAGNAITLGYEPQWVIIKRSDSAGYNWNMFDVMRGMSYGNYGQLAANLSDAEINTSGSLVIPTATGFSITPTTAAYNASGGTYIYIAIRRGPMKTPTTGTSVFQPVASGNNVTTSGTLGFTTNIVTDLLIRKGKSSGTNGFTIDRLRGGTLNLSTNLTDAESATLWDFDSNIGVNLDTASDQSGLCGWAFRRAPGFFDEVCYTGNGTANRVLNHNLGAAPELIITKQRSGGGSNWNTVYGITASTQSGIVLNTNAAGLGSFSYTPGNWILNAAPTATTITIGSELAWNGSGSTYVAYLFATCPGVSKVGSYTGTGNTLQIDCGFTGGARFVLIKATSTTGDWLVWDSARGIVAGNDPYLELNTTDAEVTNTDWVDTHSPGFELSNAVGNLANTNGTSYIFLAVA